jgi:hypothetical protein
MILCRRVSFAVISWLVRVALAGKDCGEVDSGTYRELESLADFDDDGVFDGAYKPARSLCDAITC